MDADIYVEPGYYTYWEDVPAMCVFAYVEDCYYGAYWGDYLEITGDFTWTLTD